MKLSDTPLLKNIIESAPIGSCILDVNDFAVELCNDRFSEFSGMSKETLAGKSIFDIFADQYTFDRKIISNVIKSKETIYADEVSMIFTDYSKDKDINVTFIYAPVLDDNGQISKIAIWAMENAAESKEQKIAEEKTASECERERTNAILNQIPAGIAVLSGKKLIFELVNPVYQSLVPERELLGRPFVEALPELQDSEINRALNKVYQEGVSLNFSDQLVPLSVLEHGALEERYFTFTFVPRFNSEGVVDGVFIISFEVTHIVDNQINLDQANNNLNQIINMLPASVVVIRHDELIVEMINDANLAYWKKTRDEVIGRPFLEILPDLADQPFASQLRSVMHTGEIIDIKESPVLFVEPDGMIRETFVDYTYQPLTGLDGKRDGVLVMSFEITDRIRAKKQLEKYADQLSMANHQLSELNNKLSKSESRFKYVFHEAPVAIGLLQGRDLVIESANNKILELWGKTDSIIGITLEEALPEIKDQPFLGLLDNVFSTGKPFYANEIKAMLMHEQELKEIFFNVVYQPIANTNGNIADILVVAVDVTEQVNARKLVEKSEAYFKMLADLIPAKISNALPNGEVTFFNKRWLEYSGMSFENLRDFGYQQMIHPDELEHFQSGLAEAAATGVAHVSEMRFKNKEGKFIWHLNIASPILDDNGAITMWIGSTTDIQWLKEEEQRKNDFIGMVSHELKTPLTSVNTYLQLLLKKAENTEDRFQKQAYVQSLKQIRHMTEMINGFLDVSRLESAKLHIEKADFEISALFTEVSIDYQLQYSTHEIIVDPAPTTTINADRAKIAQVLNNMVSNAVKYSEVGSRIDIFFERAGKNIRSIVKDRGMGIQPENLKKLFERYYRVEQDNKIAGFGIGLYLSAEIIKAHGGEIWAESSLGKGSTFYFELPALR
ncbi:sensor histidine kinase [Chryseobacterium chendengshani]|uniref:sensor histidine kinase n=1 Tax=Chryseobacterium sp. LJ756 TaxID=2864113 RepID=UPI001C6428F9|nr:PAS domain-containing protein [Chryseobacterium sp. LJ756]MBW7676359.1 PAS domain-containing protein [Chryseobacterium sp. LJ756]